MLSVFCMCAKKSDERERTKIARVSVCNYVRACLCACAPPRARVCSSLGSSSSWFTFPPPPPSPLPPLLAVVVTPWRVKVSGWW